MRDLIQRLQDASEGSRELDAMIEREQRRRKAYAVGLNDKTRSHWEPDVYGNVSSQGTTYASRAFSTSIDAAMTLVPEGWWWALMMDGDGGGYQSATSSVNTNNLEFLLGATPALALCIAALAAAEPAPMEKSHDD